MRHRDVKIQSFIESFLRIKWKVYYCSLHMNYYSTKRFIKREGPYRLTTKYSRPFILTYYKENMRICWCMILGIIFCQILLKWTKKKKTEDLIYIIKDIFVEMIQSPVKVLKNCQNWTHARNDFFKIFVNTNLIEPPDQRSDVAPGLRSVGGRRSPYHVPVADRSKYPFTAQVQRNLAKVVDWRDLEWLWW